MRAVAPALTAALAAAATAQSEPPPPPNLVVILVDDLGWADIGPFGGEIPTPNLDRLAAQGMKFTDFAVSSPVCSASRAALLTGCYHRRVGIGGALGPDAEIGLGDGELTLAELCRQRGYATACFGKWHLGHHPRFLPLQHGFDEYFGLPYSNDMWPLHPAYANLPDAAAARKRGYPPLPLVEGNRVVDAEVTAADQAQLTQWYTDRAVSFVERHRDRPFFLYLPHSMVHVPLFASHEFHGKSGHGRFGDVVMEIDWSVGRVLDALDRLDLAERTLVVFTSDNGPWLGYGEHAGSAGPLREGKGTTFEGGIRAPTLVRWPGHVPAGAVCSEFAATIDLLPTFARLIGAELPAHRIDGRDITPLLFGAPDAKSPHEAFYCYYDGGQLQAVRDARWKLHFAHRYATLGDRAGGKGGAPAPYANARIERSLFDLHADPGETTDVAAEHPDVVARLQRLAQAAREDLGDTLTPTEGKGIRPAGRLGASDERLRW
ncbi:MAG: sulfatase [Planctomycetes bacterium]|nr:sulfatase [Planctomycetota bacterium]